MMKRCNWRNSATTWFKRQGTVALLATATGLGSISSPVLADVIGLGDVTPEELVGDPDEEGLYQFGGTVPGVITVGGTGQNVGGTAAGQLTIDVPEETDPLFSTGGVIGGNRFGLGLVRMVSLNSQWSMDDSLIIGEFGQGFLELIAGARLSTDGNGDSTEDDPDLVMGLEAGSQGFATIDGFGSLLLSTNASIGFNGFGDLQLINSARMETLESASIGTELDLNNNELGQGYVLVDGLGTRWNVGFIEGSDSAPEAWELNIGEEGRGTLEITNQGRVQSANDTYLGAESGAHGEVIVTGRNSLLWTREEMFVGSETSTSPTTATYGTGVVNINDKGMVRNDEETTIYRLGTINLNDGTLLTPLVTNNDGVIRGAGTVDAASVVNNGDIRNAAAVASLRERLLFTGTVTNNDNIESIGGEMEFKGDVTNNTPDGDIYGKDAIFRFLGPNGLVNNSTVTLDNTIVESTAFTNNAALAVLASDTSTILGDVTLSGSSILEMELGDDFSQLWVTGDANIGGTLSLSLAPNYNPQTGDSFEILRSDALAGTFTTEIMTDNPGLLWDVSYSTSSVFVTFGAIAPPGSGADFNGDGIVNGSDLAIWQNNFGLGSNPPPAATQADGDANGDGVVDGSDFLLIQQQYGGPPPAVPAFAAVPEPSSVLLALAGFGLPLAARRRRS